MKKIILFAVLCAALSACTKNQLDNSRIAAGSEDQTSFKKGDRVTLTVGAPKNQTKVDGTMNSSGGVDFTWNTGDCIKVSVGEKSAVFTLSSGAGEANATFTGTMPEDGDTFNVQYPSDTPDLSEQSYVANALPKNKMLATATGCTKGNTVSLLPQYSALRIKLYAATSKKVGKIVITNTSDSYTLDCGSGVSLSTDSSDPTSFLVVVEPGTYGFDAEVTSEISSAYMTNSTTDSKTIESGKVLNMSTVQAVLTTGADPANAQ